MTRVVVYALIVVGTLLAIALYLVPLTAGGLRAATDFSLSDMLLTSRRWGLLGNSLLVAAGATLIALLVGASFAAGLVGVRIPAARFGLLTAGLATTLVPPYVYAYAWGLVFLRSGLFDGRDGDWLFQAQFATYGRAMLSLGIWLAPACGLLLALVWQQRGRVLCAARALDQSILRATIRTLLVDLRPEVLAISCILFAIALSEYSVCHLCSVQTFSGEIMSVCETAPGAGIRLALPLLAILAAVLGSAYWLIKCSALGDLALRDETRADLDSLRLPQRQRGARALFALLALVVLLAPFGVLVARFDDVGAFARIGRIYPDAVPIGLLQAFVASLLAAVLAVGLAALRSVLDTGVTQSVARVIERGITIIATLAFFTPPALVSVGLLISFRQIEALIPAAISVTDSWLALSIANAVRFSALTLIVVQLSRGTTRDRWHAAAQSDGADNLERFTRLTLPRVRGPLAAIVALMTLLALTEVGATFLVRPTSHGATLALTLLNDMHYGRDADVIAVCLTLGMISASVVGGLLLVGRRRIRRLLD